MKVFVTKYALTIGIQEVDVRECGDGMVVQGDGCYANYYHGEGKEWHRTRESAAARAEEMRRKKIESVKKLVAKLEAMTF